VSVSTRNGDATMVEGCRHLAPQSRSSAMAQADRTLRWL
jgi:hypothetical protein